MVLVRLLCMCVVAASVFGQAGVAAAQTYPPPPAVGLEPTPVDLGALPAVQDSMNAMNDSYTLGSRAKVIFLTWAQLEPAPGEYNFAELDAQLHSGTLLDADPHAVLMLNIEPIQVTQRAVPADLNTVAFNDRNLIARFHALIYVMIGHLDARVRYISLGEEVDGYLQWHPWEWATYQTFYTDAVKFIHQYAPQLKVGVATAWIGQTGLNGSNVTGLNGSSDVLVWTYTIPSMGLGQTYAQLANAPTTDFGKMVTQAKGKPVVLQELGFPSSTNLGSSETIQASYVQNVFTAWAARRDLIPFVNFVQLHDYSRWTCDHLQVIFQLSAWANFSDYLCSMGLLQADGTPKQSIVAFAAGARILNGVNGW